MCVQNIDKNNVGNFCILLCHTSIIKIELNEAGFTVGTRHSADEFYSFISLI